MTWFVKAGVFAAGLLAVSAGNVQAQINPNEHPKTPSYSLDAQGKCHGPDGKVVKTEMCKTVKTCRDPKTGKIVKCKDARISLRKAGGQQEEY
jgi:hypothetical protein